MQAVVVVVAVVVVAVAVAAVAVVIVVVVVVVLVLVVVVVVVVVVVRLLVCWIVTTSCAGSGLRCGGVVETALELRLHESEPLSSSDVLTPNIEAWVF